MSNFDVFNDTGQNVYGAELDLDVALRLEVDAAGARAKLTCRREEGKLRAKLKTRLVVLG